MFKPLLKKIVDNIDGGVASVIMGLDGIAVDSYIRVSDRVDINTVAMEFSYIMGQVRKAADSLRVGSCDELTVKAPQLLLAVRMLSPQYFLAIAMSPEANFGKCRYLMRLNAGQISAQL